MVIVSLSFEEGPFDISFTFERGDRPVNHGAMVASTSCYIRDAEIGMI
jgi:hypothetical protein